MNRIRELRQAAGLKQLVIAKLCDVSLGTISYWEKGTYEPNQESLIKLADYFGVSVDYILGRDEIAVEDTAAMAVMPDEEDLIVNYRTIKKRSQDVADTILTLLEQMRDL